MGLTDQPQTMNMVIASTRITEILPFYKIETESHTQTLWLFSIDCGISTKQEMELLSCNLTSCFLCQSFTDLQRSKT